VKNPANWEMGMWYFLLAVACDDDFCVASLCFSCLSISFDCVFYFPSMVLFAASSPPLSESLLLFYLPFSGKMTSRFPLFPLLFCEKLPRFPPFFLLRRRLLSSLDDVRLRVFICLSREK
jgi:hypothetical protein